MKPAPQSTHAPPYSIVLLLFLFLTFTSTASADWPTYRHDAARTGFTPEPIPAQLSLRWTHHASAPPQPAWPRSARMTYDRAFHPVIRQGLLFFGSSADGKIHALDALTGTQRWSFQTDAPVRFAPALWEDRLYAVSDDGHLYCLDTAQGRLLWKQRGGPDDRMILGNSRMISRWPARGGPVLHDGIVYFAAGIWPTEGIYLHALDARSGRPIWLNDTAGSLYLGQPHGGAFAHSGVSAQGYLAANDQQLFLPTGRSVPAAFHRADGRFQYFQLQANGQRGGSSLVISDQFLINGGFAFLQENGDATGKIGPGVSAAIPGGLVRSTGPEVLAFRWVDKVTVDRKGEEQIVRSLEQTCQVNLPNAGDAGEIIVAGQHLIIGSANTVTMVDTQTAAIVWSAPVRGTAHSLAVSDGRLYAATDQGILYCFDASQAQPNEIRATLNPSPYEPDERFSRAAHDILLQTGITQGYCLDLASGDGHLAFELAKQSQLHIIAVEPDPRLVQNARAKLSAAGFYGSRVTVLQRDPSQTRLPNYFANLIVSGASTLAGPDLVPLEEAQRLQRPSGGVLCLGKPGALTPSTRGPLPGAGNWTHQYSDPGNTACSDDALIQGPLGMLWFADLQQQMTQRHGRAPAPLFQDGILYGSLANPEHVVTYRYLKGGDMTRQLTESTALFALDAKTGRLLWRHNATHSIRHNTIAIGADHLAFIDRPLALYDRVRDAKPTNEHSGELIALHARSGAVLWKNTNDIYGTLTAISADHQKLIMAYQPTRFSLASEIGGRIACFNLVDGRLLWEKSQPYSSRPLINDRTVYAEGGAWDLLTGQDRPFNFQRSYGCGILTGAKHLMAFRSATLGYFDLKDNSTTSDFGGLRPGCWINIIPAGGLLFAPDASAGCQCSYQNQSWIALQPLRNDFPFDSR